MILFTTDSNACSTPATSNLGATKGFPSAWAFSSSSLYKGKRIYLQANRVLPIRKPEHLAILAMPRLVTNECCQATFL